MPLALETIVLVAGIAALVISAVTLGSLDKIKKDIPDADKKHFDMARNSQIALIVISAITVVLSGWLVAGNVRGKALYGAGALRGLASRLVA